MLYINNNEQTYKTYDEAVEIAVGNGVDRKRAYVYLMALGVKSAMARVLSSDGQSYLPAEKVAVKDGKVVTRLEVCKNCKGLLVE